MNDDNSQQDKKLRLKSEVITIEEDEVQSDNVGVIKEEQADRLCYESLPEEKTDINKTKSSIKILCVDCPAEVVFEDRSAFEKHWNINHQAQPIVFACVVCEYNAKKFILLRNHTKRHLGRYECSDCSSTYSQKSDLNYHRTTVHGLKVCRKCSLEFESVDMFEEHKNTHAKTSVSKVKSSKSSDKSCPDCGKILQTSGGLFTHRKMHLEKPKFRCEVCSKEFFQKVNLLNHEKTHNIQNRNYNCSQCDKSFFEKSHLLRHQNFHSESRDFQCNLCLKFYKTERCLKVHKQVHSDPLNRPFKCSVCQKGFLSSSKLKQHANIHENLRPYKCKHCPRDFTNYPNLLKHTIRRHKVDHRTGKPLSKIPDYVTNKKKKKTTEDLAVDAAKRPELQANSSMPATNDEINVIKIPDDDLELPSTSGLIRGFQFGEDTNYDMSIMLDIDDFSDFQLLSPNKDDLEGNDDGNDTEQFSIIDSDLQFFNENPIIHLVSSGQ